eukprot:8404906-Pyramimonas_sp.AAC.1
MPPAAAAADVPGLLVPRPHLLQALRLVALQPRDEAAELGEESLVVLAEQGREDSLEVVEIRGLRAAADGRLDLEQKAAQ